MSMGDDFHSEALKAVAEKANRIVLEHEMQAQKEDAKPVNPSPVYAYVVIDSKTREIQEGEHIVVYDDEKYELNEGFEWAKVKLVLAS